MLRKSNGQIVFWNQMVKLSFTIGKPDRKSDVPTSLNCFKQNKKLFWSKHSRLVNHLKTGLEIGCLESIWKLDTNMSGKQTVAEQVCPIFGRPLSMIGFKSKFTLLDIDYRVSLHQICIFKLPKYIYSTPKRAVVAERSNSSNSDID
jgi:hypothetical protein